MSSTKFKSFFSLIISLALIAGCGGGGLEPGSEPSIEATSTSVPAPANSSVPGSAITSASALENAPATELASQVAPELENSSSRESAIARSSIALPQRQTVASTFGLKADTNYFTVDTGAGLVFKVRRMDNGSHTQSIGDIASMVYNGVEYQDQSRGSQVNSGFDFLYDGVNNVTVSAKMVDVEHIKVTVDAGHLTHYYMAKKGETKIYMATYFSSEPSLGQVRFIVRVPINVLPNGPAPSNIRNNTGAIESADIFGLSNGETRSKHYSNMRLKDWAYIGATSSRAGMWIVRDNNEGNSGGPFYRSLLNQGTDTDQELTYIINYGEGQTEKFRPGILNAYTLVFTKGTPPGTVDTSWFAQMGLTGFIAPSARGRVTGIGINGRDPQYKYTVGFSNEKAQYWTEATGANGNFDISGMIPGTYTMKIYKNELEVDTRTVVVNASSVTALHTISITGDPSAVTPIWRIGDWDGTPREFLNGDKVTIMHPSDARMRPWTTPDYVVGISSPATGFPAYQWKEVNGAIRIKFNLGPNQIADTMFRVGITTAYANGRPVIKVNNWTSRIPNPSIQPSSRTLTVGTYRGNNTIYSFNIPASALVVGENILTLNVASGSGGAGYLSAGVSYDALDLIPMQ
jgi:rhamnogalacturonan endolyase